MYYIRASCITNDAIWQQMHRTCLQCY